MLFSVSHRMIELSFERGLNEFSPLAFAQFGVTALCMGNACGGYRCVLVDSWRICTIPVPALPE